MAGFGDVLGWVKHEVSSRVPKADLDQRDADYIREQLPGLWLLASLYFRADVRGLDRIPADGPVLLCSDPTAARDSLAATEVKELLLELAGLPPGRTTP